MKQLFTILTLLPFALRAQFNSETIPVKQILNIWDSAAVHFKTVNGNSLIGNGDVQITGGGSITNSIITTALGFTPVNPSSLATVATSGNYSDLLSKPTIPTNTNQLTNGNGYLTSIDTTNIPAFSVKVRSLFNATAPIIYANGNLSVTQATASTNGYLSSTDWNTFNSKQAAGSYLITTGSAALLTSFPTLNQNTTGTAAGLSTPLSFSNGGSTGSAALATSGTISVSMVNSLLTIIPTGTCTFNATGGYIGQYSTFVITTSGTISFTLTWGTNYKPVTTLSTGTTAGKIFTVTFICTNGTQWVEITRTVAH